MKAVNYTWWIGAIIGAILTLTLTGGSAKDNTGILIITGVVSGAFLGWLIGFIIDKAYGKANKEILDSTEKIKVENNDTNIKEPFNNSKKFYGLSAQIAYRTAQIIGGNTMVDAVISIHQPAFDKSISLYRIRNIKELEDPLLGPINLMKFMNISADKLKESFLNEENFGMTRQEVEEVVKKIYQNSYKKNFNSKAELTIRRDGYYISEENSLNSFIIIFTSKGYVAMQEMEEGDILNYSNDDLVQIISEGEALTELEISDRLTKYEKNGEYISMKFYDPEDSSNMDPILKIPYPEPITYNKWSGKIIPNGLLLDLEKREFSYALKDYEKINVVRDLKFKFVPINMN